MRFPIENDPARKGQIAAPKKLFGQRNRYAVAPIYSRFDSVGFFVWDAETQDMTQEKDPIMGYPPAVIRIADSLEKALEGLI